MLLLNTKTFSTLIFPQIGSFDIPDIDPFLCTHLNYGFANMDNSTWKLVAYDPWYSLLIYLVYLPSRFDLSPSDEGCDAAHCKYGSYDR